MKVFVPLNETTMALITPTDRLVPYQAGQPVLSQVKRSRRVALSYMHHVLPEMIALHRINMDGAEVLTAFEVMRFELFYPACGRVACECAPRMRLQSETSGTYSVGASNNR